MEYLYLALKFLMASLFILIGIHHFKKPKFYYPIIPDFFPKKMVTYISGIVELVLGIGLFITAYEKQAAFGIFILMLIFLPLHVWDITREKPAMGSKKNAYIRLLIQFGLIAWAWFIYSKEII
ncbi:DoxX family protein [Tenacibaculum agarivorans]|uniref:DoxX family protein n=1 Tax=Tenacibaculum agarivorans TaxID=1908389 RepID=UPI00094BB7A8|nr:MauE/DoxX family redox-associated membrane protein [Tenacibaculum agarivorans]